MRRGSAILLGCAVFCCGCYRQPAHPPPVEDTPAATQIPVDLDLILRAEVSRLRADLGPEFLQALRARSDSEADPALAVLWSALSSSDKLYAGLRLNLDPNLWDYVLITEGRYEELSDRALHRAFKPGRPLGAGYVAFDAWQVQDRLSVARLYRYQESKMIFVSAAEVDAVERVIELGRSERLDVPPARGLLSFASDLGRISRELRDEFPRAARLLDGARQVTGFFDLSARQLRCEARFEFHERSDAERAVQALQVVKKLLLAPLSPKPPEVSVTAVGSDVTVTLSAEPSLLARWLGMR